jgi:hypothetical protein
MGELSLVTLANLADKIGAGSTLTGLIGQKNNGCNSWND